jgi:hypothetical protein
MAKVVPGRLLVAGSASSTIGGTVKLPSLTRAVQVKDTVTVLVAVAPYAVLSPVIATYPAGSPPLQVMGRPFARFTVVVLD